MHNNNICLPDIHFKLYVPQNTLSSAWIVTISPNLCNYLSVHRSVKQRDKIGYKVEVLSKFFLIWLFFTFRGHVFATTYGIKRWLPSHGRHSILLDISTWCIKSIADDCVTKHNLHLIFTQLDKDYQWMLRKCSWWHIESNNNWQPLSPQL